VEVIEATLTKHSSEWTKGELAEMVKYLRHQRVLWESAEAQAKAKGTRPRMPKPKMNLKTLAVNARPKGA